MDQVSLPLRIALAVVLAFAALWFVALRPKPVEDVAAEPAPAQDAAPNANAAVAQGGNPSSGGKAGADPGATGGTATPADPGSSAASPGSRAAGSGSPSPGSGSRATGSGSRVATAKAKRGGSSAKAERSRTSTKAARDAKASPAGAPASASKAKGSAVARGRGARAILADLEAGRTVVLLVWDGKSADDRSVRRSVARLDRRGGKVRVHVTTIKRLSQYEAITKGVPITESPTVLVIDRKRRARVISGLTVTAEIDDTIDRALRAR